MKHFQRPFISLIYSLFLWSRISAVELSQDVIAATQPLHRNIDSLKEKLDAMEARHETLEAATEQFRLKVKSLNEKLLEEKARYDWLTNAKADQEKKDNEKIEKLKSRIEAIQNAKAAMEKEYESKLVEERKKHETAMANARKAYETVLASEKKAYEAILQDERNKHLQYEIKLTKKTNEVELQRDQIKVLKDEQTKLQSSFRTQGEGLSSVKLENEQLREQLLHLRNEVQQLEVDLEKARWRPPSWNDVAESEVVSATLDVLFEYWEWLKDDVVPHSIERLSGLMKAIEHNGMIFIEEANEYFQGGRAALVESLHDIDSTRTLLQRISIFFVGAMDDAWLRTLSFAARIWEENFTPILEPYLSKNPMKFIIRVASKLTELHNAMASTLEWTAATLSAHYVTSLGGSQSHWFYTTCICTKDHSHRIILLLEVALGLLALDVSLTSLRRSRKRFGGGRRISKHHHHSILHPKGPVPSASLLRTAGGYPLRHP